MAPSGPRSWHYWTQIGNPDNPRSGSPPMVCRWQGSPEQLGNRRRFWQLYRPGSSNRRGRTQPSICRARLAAWGTRHDGQRQSDQTLSPQGVAFGSASARDLQSRRGVSPPSLGHGHRPSHMPLVWRTGQPAPSLLPVCWLKRARGPTGHHQAHRLFDARGQEQFGS